MTVLANIAIGAPVNAAITSQFGVLGTLPQRISLQANFTVGAVNPQSNSSSVSAWIQTTIDDGLTWIDAANFTFNAASERMIMTVYPPVAVSSPLAATDGTLQANSAAETVLGPLWRVKYTVTGQYASGTTLRIDMV